MNNNMHLKICFKISNRYNIESCEANLYGCTIIHEILKHFMDELFSTKFVLNVIFLFTFELINSICFSIGICCLIQYLKWKINVHMKVIFNFDANSNELVILKNKRQRCFHGVTLGSFPHHYFQHLLTVLRKNYVINNFLGIDQNDLYEEGLGFINEKYFGFLLDILLISQNLNLQINAKMDYYENHQKINCILKLSINQRKQFIFCFYKSFLVQLMADFRFYLDEILSYFKRAIQIISINLEIIIKWFLYIEFEMEKENIKAENIEIFCHFMERENLDDKVLNERLILEYYVLSYQLCSYLKINQNIIITKDIQIIIQISS
ncbi:unnamed protein product (macronuclear) [Paramecium tetraurelia]|uniref:Uncharacterized protein n=1 Tax=Paramecium tetraurelia TaxID=5888 RepID=A0CHH4_PARTE|nr:uncharacterized protein GSPATT00038343001 [Paramecium tetraurelia]CAK70241.1 unnamed protein product [Paramecium tetraurelia]|eukprot:XP_001437638.1 hypothetical protein (macronuclear) [Paramecium tetraurelia strain d4-2]